MQNNTLTNNYNPGDIMRTGKTETKEMSCKIGKAKQTLGQSSLMRPNTTVTV